jgi:hypothetical protein
VDLTKVTAVELGFSTPALGSIQLADVMFRETPQAAAPTGAAGSGVVDVPAVVPKPDGPPSVAPGAIVDVPPSAPTPSAAAETGHAKACVDTSKPATKVRRLTVARVRLLVSGSASDTGCAAGVLGTLVEVFQPAGKGKARFVTAKGTLSKPLPLAGGIAIAAKGSAAWSITIAKAKLPAGKYQVRVSTFDKTGNLKQLPVTSVKVK